MQKRRFSVDAIAKYMPPGKRRHYGKYVVIERLSFPLGLAWPGGGIEEGEDKEEAVVREVDEETGLSFVHNCGSQFQAWLPRMYDEDGRDPRWPATSYVAYGYASGMPKNEEGKTRVLFLSKEEILAFAKELDRANKPRTPGAN